MLLTEHATFAAAAFELSTKMSSMPLPDYLAFANKLDVAQVAYPPSF